MPAFLSKVKTFEELYSAVKLKFRIGKPSHPVLDGTDKAYCFSVLEIVSRSFALVIQELPEELCDAVCVFYLVLRALDTVEDDPDFDEKEKLDWLAHFHERLNEPFTIQNCGHRDYYRDLMQNFDKVCRFFLTLKKEYQIVIQDITKRMADGMMYFLEHDVVTVKDYDVYCHHVAGLVGYGLTDLFVASGLETEELGEKKETCGNGMGLFLQKTNIIRDYWEDIREDRVFWPQEIWKKYADNIEAFKYEKNFDKGVQCINELVNNALKELPLSIEYMETLRNKKIFNFCAIPQTMAIATLAEVYENRQCFEKLVKIRKGLAAHLIYETTDIIEFKRITSFFLRKILKKINQDDPNSKETRQICNDILRQFKVDGTFNEGVKIVGPCTFSIFSVTLVGGFFTFRYKSYIKKVLNDLWTRVSITLSNVTRKER